MLGRIAPPGQEGCLRQ